MNEPNEVARIGRCIYCGGPGTTKEHIIPQALGGRRYLADASCDDCRKMTSDFETIVARDMYWPLRLRLGIRGSPKHKKERPTHWPGVIIDGNDETDLPLEVGKHPLIYYAVVMPPPGILTGAPISDVSREDMKLEFKASPSDFDRFTREFGVGTFESSFNFHWGAFCQQIAKIGHCYSVGNLGFDGIEYFLPSLITGSSPYFSHYIGGAEEELDPQDELALELIRQDGETYISTRMTFFGGGRLPTYQAICGRVTDMSLVRKIERPTAVS